MVHISITWVVLLLAALHARCRPQSQERISYGKTVPKGSMEYFVQVSIDKGNGWFDCGGSFLSTNVVVTAAHCLYGDSGELTTRGVRISDKKATGVGVARPSVYSPFKNGDFTGDIALIKLDIEVGSSVVQIAPRGTKLEDTEVLVAGKGQTEKDMTSAELQYIIVPTMSNSDMLMLFGTDVETDGDYSDHDDSYLEMNDGKKDKSSDMDVRTAPSSAGRNDGQRKKKEEKDKKGKQKKDAIYSSRAYEEDHFGAGDRKADSCRGDSGGPAVWPSRSMWGKRGRNDIEEDVLVGIVSYGPAVYQCGDRGSFGLYTDVGYWEEWIQTTIKKDMFEKIKSNS